MNDPRKGFTIQWFPEAQEWGIAPFKVPSWCPDNKIWSFEKAVEELEILKQKLKIKEKPVYRKYIRKEKINKIIEI